MLVFLYLIITTSVFAFKLYGAKGLLFLIPVVIAEVFVYNLQQREKKLMFKNNSMAYLYHIEKELGGK